MIDPGDASAAPSRSRGFRRRLGGPASERSTVLSGLIGSAILVAAWEILAVAILHHSLRDGIPAPSAVVTQLWVDLKSGLYGSNLLLTLKQAATGFVVGNIVAIVLAVAFVQVPILEKALLNVAVASYCLPIVAIGPILTFVLNGDAPESTLAGLLVFFPTLVGVAVGLRSADRTTLDMIHAYGGGAWTKLTRVRLRAALPSTFAALQIAGPSAILGAIVGEYLGGQGTGIGIVLINSESDLDIARTWGIALVCTAIAGILYGLIGLLGRVAAPWAPRRGLTG